MNSFNLLCVNIHFYAVAAFIPHPAIRFGGQAGESITHTDMTQLGFIRSLGRFFLGTHHGNQVNAEIFNSTHTIDELYQLVHLDWSSDQVKLYSHPLKSIIDHIQVRDALVDLNPSTKDLPSAHFDTESFIESNRRIMDLRKKVIEDATNPNKDLDSAREKIGDLLHTLQDFYSHSNWIEMSKTEINHRIGMEENIGQIADIHQATCISDGCKNIKSKCSILQKLILKNCPMEYYDCKNNIRDEINKQDILTNGYMSNQLHEKEEPLLKPTNIEKCSHGSVMDKTAHQSPFGGINKDTMTPVYSPHYHLHFEAAKLAIQTTEQFFNDLCKDIGNENFDRLFAINLTEKHVEMAVTAIENNEKFHFLTATLSIGLSSGDINFQKRIKQRLQEILSIVFDNKDPDVPTYTLNDIGVDRNAMNIHSGSLLIDSSKTIKSRRLSQRR